MPTGTAQMAPHTRETDPTDKSFKYSMFRDYFGLQVRGAGDVLTREHSSISVTLPTFQRSRL